MHRGKISGILSPITIIIIIITLYLGNLIQTNAPLTFYLGNGMALFSIIFLIAGTVRAFISGPPGDDYDATQKYFIGGITFIGIGIVVYILSYKEILIDSMYLFIIYCFLLISCIGILVIATFFYQPEK